MFLIMFQTPILPPSTLSSPQDSGAASLPQVIPSKSQLAQQQDQHQSSSRKRATPVYGTIPASVAK